MVVCEQYPDGSWPLFCDPDRAAVRREVLHRFIPGAPALGLGALAADLGFQGIVEAWSAAVARREPEPVVRGADARLLVFQQPGPGPVAAGGAAGLGVLAVLGVVLLLVGVRG